MKEKNNSIKDLIVKLLPVVAVVVLFILYMSIMVSNGYKIDLQLKRLINQTVVLIVVSTGATFIYSLGTFDISLGAETLFACVIGVLVYNNTNSLFLLVISLFAVGICCSLLSALLANFFNIPAFVTTVAMMSVLSATASTLININNTSGGISSISISSAVLEGLSSENIKIIIVLSFVGLCTFIYNFTDIGRKIKFLGGNPNCAKLTGIKESKYIIIAFLMAGISVGLGALLTLIYTPSVSSSTAGSLGMNILIAIVFGGMPISGGPKSKIYAASIGGVSYMLLSQILLWTIGTNYNGLVQIVSAVLFILLVFVTSRNYKTNMLPR